jgi:Fe-S cluster assembly protein SufB
VIFCRFRGLREYPDLVRHLGSVAGLDNYFAALNSAVVFSDGSPVYIPLHALPDGELSTYFRINASQTGQFERT